MKKKAAMVETDNLNPEVEAPEATSEDIKEDKKEPIEYNELAAQIKSEVNYATAFMRPKWKKWAARLKLYNNQKRDDTAVGDPLLFTTFNTVFSSLYDDEIGQEWEPNEEGDEDAAECLNILSIYQWKKMGMALFTHDFMWDASFFCHAVADMSEYSREDKMTVPYVIDPMTYIRDPKASSIRGQNGRGASRFFYYELSLTMSDIEQMDDFMNIDKLANAEVGQKTDIQINHDLRQQAQGYDNVDTSKVSAITGENKEYVFLVGYTHFNGKKVRVLTDTKMETVFRFLELPEQKFFPLADMEIYPMPGMWDGVSIPDLVEDKQRHRAAIINSAMRGVKLGQNPSYIFNANKVNRNEIAKTAFGNLIPADGDPNNVVAIMPRDQVKQDVAWILDTLSKGAQTSTATPEMQQGVTSTEKRTLGELNLVSSKVGTRYSLTAKIFGMGFSIFWNQWYLNHKHYLAKDIDKLMVRIKGPNGAKWRTLMRDNIITEIDPDVTIDSKSIIEAKRFNELSVFNNFFGMAVKDPSFNAQGGLKKIAKLSNIKADEMDILFRKSVDEEEAERENEALNSNVLKKGEYEVKLNINQNHDLHIEVHGKANENQAKEAHIEAHHKAKILQRDNMAVKQMMAQSQQMNPGMDANAAIGQNNAGMTTNDISGEMNNSIKQNA